MAGVILSLQDATIYQVNNKVLTKVKKQKKTV